MIRDTSINSLEELKNNLGIMQQIVFRTIINHPYSTDRELCVFLGVNDPNVVRPRRKELLDLGLINDYGVRKCTVTTKKAHMWDINPLNKQEGL